MTRTRTKRGFLLFLIEEQAPASERAAVNTTGHPVREDTDPNSCRSPEQLWNTRRETRLAKCGVRTLQRRAS